MCDREIWIEFERALEFAFGFAPIPIMGRGDHSGDCVRLREIRVDLESFSDSRLSEWIGLVRRHVWVRRHNVIRFRYAYVSQGEVGVELYRLLETLDTSPNIFVCSPVKMKRAFKVEVISLVVVCIPISDALCLAAGKFTLKFL